MVTYLCYGVLAMLIYFAIPSMLQMMFGGLFSLATFRAAGTYFTLLVGGYCAWLMIAALWYLVEGDYIPMAALAAGFNWLFIHGWLERHQLTKESTLMMAGEAWGIVLLAGTIYWHSGAIRWI